MRWSEKNNLSSKFAKVIHDFWILWLNAGRDGRQ